MRSLKRKVSSTPKAGVNIFINPYSFYVLHKREFNWDDVDNIFVDGGLLVLLLRYFKAVDVKRVSFDYSSYAKVFFEEREKIGGSVSFIGSDTHSINKFVKNINNKYPSLLIRSYRNGYFDNIEEKYKCVRNIVDNIKPDFVIVGMGTPAQEEFSLLLKESGYQGTIFTCGGFIHQSVDSLIYYPSLINKLNLRFLWRIYKEKGLLNRYIKYYPKAIIYILFRMN